MASLVCRRFPQRVSKATAFSSIDKCARKNISNENCKDPGSKEQNTGTIEKVNHVEYRVHYNPSAYTRVKNTVHQHIMEDSEDLIEHNYSSTGVKQVQNMYSVTCSRRLSSTKNTLLELAFNKPVPQSTSVQTLKQKEKKDMQESDVEAYDSKEDPRTFQNLRPEYRSLCVGHSEGSRNLSVEEGDMILHKVAVLKSSLTLERITDSFCKLSSLPLDQLVVVRSNTRFAMLCRYSVENLHLFSVDQLINILKAFVHLGIPPAHSMLHVYEVEFCRRVWDMNLNQLLLVADMWRVLGRSVPQYLEIFASFVNLHWKDLTLPQLVQLTYVVGEGRKGPQELMLKLEPLLLRYLDLMNEEEIGAVCLGFFKSNNGLSEHVMCKIGDKVSTKMEEISSFALVNVLKMFRYTHIAHLNFLKRLGEVVPQHLPSIGTQGIMHIALACAALHYLDERLMNAIAAVVPSRVKYCRSKDIAKFLWAFGSLNYEPPNAGEFYSSLIEEICKRLHEFEKFPEHFLTSLLALAFAQQFPLDLIDLALSERFVQLAIGRSTYELKKDLFTLDGSVGIECLNYKGSRLNLQVRQEVTEMIRNFASQDICVKPEVLEAVTLLATILGGSHYIKNHMILPHTRSNDLEVHLDINGKPIPFNKEVTRAALPNLEMKATGVYITDDLMGQLLKGKGRAKDSMESEEVKLESRVTEQKKTGLATETLERNHVFSEGVPLSNYFLNSLTASKTCQEQSTLQLKKDTGIVKLAIQVSHRNHYCYASKQLLGLHSLKRRQLHLLGYTVVELPYWEWFPLLSRSRSEKLAYLHHKVFGTLN
ncbi:FAST kinase domain-containing protein 5, mitochondrial isoform X2 [Microcaecilia unicolor]|uniref:FAST kinase domain-containing protein 5, mitochondrial isoform X2 n=1 Tax=Microcaecilia unicolor TaxID=1415580 RepID=A0A6P7WUN5_9AMPH|nr:FAST kinase domain-containing protein 5, mitochondrial isoform X2 [Microcaecilia unicolor]XP_030046862.1 FAST kinase domain-containing protein 5, mitochondrial isoform X2 [Microcaecilia unicolor]XP_030046863.1 FAST kinase domain-containing protein 5, mitochondrial isoform X2 [Microcaecilia unicolor]